jgi:hypothetical protein
MEFAFELALCAHLEKHTDWLPARQLGGAVADPGSRIVDVCAVVPTDEVATRARITDAAIPAAAIHSDVGVGEAVFWKDAFECGPGRARRATERAIEVGFFEPERRGGRQYVRQAARYPDWVDRLVGIENKPDLGSPGALERQLRHDASLALFDQVVLATESYVTRAHLNRIPDPIGVWRFDPDTDERTVVREPDTLDVSTVGVEPRERHPLRTDLAFVDPTAKTRRRTAIAERAYGKGWRTYDWPGCDRCVATADGRPHCEYYARIVDPAADCGPACGGYVAGDQPGVDVETLREERTPWVRDPDGVDRQQAGLDQFS